MESLPSHDGPAIVAGDFNTFTAKYQKDLTRVLRRYGFLYVSPDRDRKTILNTLDHIYVKKLKVRAAKVDVTYTSSDHFPIFVDLEYLATS